MQGNCKPSDDKAKSKSKRKGEQHGKEGEGGFTRWRGTKTNKKHKLVKNAQSGRTRYGITPSTGLTQAGGRATVDCSSMGASGKTVAIDAESNACRKHLNVRRFDDV